MAKECISYDDAEKREKKLNDKLTVVKQVLYITV